jgi:hypothetical protein
LDKVVLKPIFLVLKLGSKYYFKLQCFGEKMQKNKKILLFATLSLLLCSVLSSTANAADDNTTAEPTPDLPQTSDTPMLIATQNGTLSGDDGTLYQANENSTETTQPPAANSDESGDVLIATQSNPDYSGYIIAGTVLAAVILACVFIIIRKRK